MIMTKKKLTMRSMAFFVVVAFTSTSLEHKNKDNKEHRVPHHLGP